jgi:hypothetical protein
MSPPTQSSAGRKLWRSVRTFGVLLAWLVLLWGPGVISPNLGWPYVAVFDLVALLIVGLIRMRQIHRRGQTIPEAWAAGQAERRQRKAEQRLRGTLLAATT